MTKNEFLQLTKKGILYLDGATGSNLMAAGMPVGCSPEDWILSHEDVILRLQESFVEAGSQILYAPTFTCNRVKLEEYGLAEHILSMNTRLVALSKKAAKDKAFVAGDITMTGKQLKPNGTFSFEELVTVYKEQAIILKDAGVDLFVIETMMSLQETRAAILAIKEICDLPILVTMTFEKNGRSLYGTNPMTAAIMAESLGVDAVGANCSTGPDDMANIIRQMASHVSLPIIAKPNAGLPILGEDGETIYDRDSVTFASQMKTLVLAGASILGGCCGTTPGHIALMVQETKEMSLPEKSSVQSRRFLTTETDTVSFELDNSFMVIGERINPTGKKLLQEELRDNNFSLVTKYAQEQVENGATFLDINMGMSGINELEMMVQAIEKVTSIVNVPLVIDSSYIEVMEAALRQYPGRALINSISYETNKTEQLLSIAKKYGAMFILLPLSDHGLPKTFEEKIDIINKLVKKAQEIGFRKEDIIVDGLVTTVGANKMAAIETLETIRYCKKHGLATVCGLSNISFGLPERAFINTAFLTLAIEAGLTMAIANPGQDLLVNASYATDLLLNKTDSDTAYIERMNHINNKDTNEGNKGNDVKIGNGVPTTKEALFEAVVKGKRDNTFALTKQCIAEGETPNDVLNLVLLPAIDQVGNLFESGKYFLPQLISGAEAMKNAIDFLEPLLLKEKNDTESSGVIVIATVKGDIHDIGKNLVALMLKIYGFKVIDLGKDVPKEKIVEAAICNHADIIGLSALMTTTMIEMKSVVFYAKKMGCTSKIIIGGAVITEEYAKEIGAAGYSKDAQDAVKLAKRLIL